jgi:hypothetical protein
MKLSELLEMVPVFKNSEADTLSLSQLFFTDESISRDFSIIGIAKINNIEYKIVLKKSQGIAFIGEKGKRKLDGKPGIEIIGDVEFKHKQTISGLKSFPPNDKILQVRTVVIEPNNRIIGLGFYLYLTLAKAGYMIVSDNTQYIGGKALWKKITAKVLKDDYAVYVLDHGEVRLDDKGDPIVYDGSNIDDAELWSENVDKKYTLFALRSKI